MKITDQEFASLYKAYNEMPGGDSKKFFTEWLPLGLGRLVDAAREELGELDKGRVQYAFSDDINKAKPKALVFLILLRTNQNCIKFLQSLGLDADKDEVQFFTHLDVFYDNKKTIADRIQDFRDRIVLAKKRYAERKESQKSVALAEQRFQDLYKAYDTIEKPESQKLLRDNLDDLVEMAKAELPKLAAGEVEYFYSDDVKRASPKAVVLLALLGDNDRKMVSCSNWAHGAETAHHHTARQKWLKTLTPLQRDFIDQSASLVRNASYQTLASIAVMQLSEIESQHQSWVQKSQVSKLFNARFVSQMHEEAGKELDRPTNKNKRAKKGHDGPVYMEPTDYEVMEANLVGLFTVLAKNFKKDTVAFPEASNLAKIALAKLKEKITPRFQEDLDAARVTSINKMYYINQEVDNFDLNIESILVASRRYLTSLQAYAKHLQELPPEQQKSSEYMQELQEHIDERKAKLYALEMLCTKSDTMAAAVWKRAKGAGVGVLPGFITTVGGAVGLACDTEAKKVAMEALQDIGKGLFDKFRDGLVAGNPILVSLTIGLCLGLLGAFLGAVSAAEVSSHMKHEPEAIKFFEKILLENATRSEQQQR